MQNAVSGGPFVRPNEEAISVDGHVVTGIGAGYERLPRRLGGTQVLEVNVAARPTVLDGHDQPATILAHGAAHEGLRVSRFFADDTVALRTGPKLVEMHLGVTGSVGGRHTARGGHPSVVDAFA